MIQKKGDRMKTLQHGVIPFGTILASVALLMLLAIKFALWNNKMPKSRAEELCSTLINDIPKTIEKTFLLHNEIKAVAEKFYKNQKAS